MKTSMLACLLTANLAVLSGCSDNSPSASPTGPSPATFTTDQSVSNVPPDSAETETSVNIGGKEANVTPEEEATNQKPKLIAPAALSSDERDALTALFKSENAPQSLVMPRIQKFEADQSRGFLQIDFESRIVVYGDNSDLFESLNTSRGWVHKLRQLTGLELPLVQTTDLRAGDIVLRRGGSEKLKSLESVLYQWRNNLSKSVGREVAQEGYQFIVSNNGVDITFNQNAGAIRSLETIGQLLLLDGRQPHEHLALPLGEALDYPNFEYRAVMIDVARQFVPMKDLIGLMEVMSLAKLNILHLHLSDNVDAIDTANGANGYIRLWDPSLSSALISLKPKDLTPNGRATQFYTKADIAELERVAATYGIEIVPEIDVPGHSRAFTDLHPEFRLPGARGREMNSLNVNNPAVLPFITNALIEYAGFFKSKKFHIGGDEPFGTQRQDWARFMDALAEELAKASVGSDRLFHWSNSSGPIDTSNKYTIYSWDLVSRANLRGRPYVDATQIRYLVPYMASSTFNGTHPAERAPGSAEIMWDRAGLPIGGALTVWNDNGERFNYGYEIMNTALKFMMTPMGYTYWNGIMLKADNRTKIEYVDQKTGFPAVAHEFNSTWVKDRFPYLTGKQAVNLVLDSASWRVFVGGQYISRKAANDPLGYDPLDLASAFKGPLFIRDGEDFIVDMPGEGRPFISRPHMICRDPEIVKRPGRISRCDEDVWSNDLQDAANVNVAGTLRKLGPGKLTMNGFNSYRGKTLVEGGTLVVKHAMSSEVTVSEGANYIGPELGSGVLHIQ